MAFKLISSGGSVSDAAVVNMPCSGTVWPGGVVDLLRTGGQGVSAASGVSSSTMVFGVSLDYVQGKSDAYAKVIPFNKAQLWAADCYNSALTSHVGIRHIVRTTGTDAKSRFLENTATDAKADAYGVFVALAVDTSIGSGKLIGRFIQNDETDWADAL